MWEGVREREGKSLEDVWSLSEGLPTLTCPRTHTCAHTHTHTRAHTQHTHTPHTHTHTHTHTHMYPHHAHYTPTLTHHTHPHPLSHTQCLQPQQMVYSFPTKPCPHAIDALCSGSPRPGHHLSSLSVCQCKRRDFHLH